MSLSNTAALPLEPRSRSLVAARTVGTVLAASLFIAASAHVAVPLPFTPVPFTLQPFAVILVGMLLGPAMGFAALAAYLCEGAAGLPVFTPGVLQGVARLAGPTGGYLMAYPAAAAIAGFVPRLLSRMGRTAAFAIGGTAAMLTVYAAGALWFSIILHVSFRTALAGTVLPFAPWDAVKVIAAAGLASTVLQTRSAGH